jgi:hypothetical protein
MKVIHENIKNIVTILAAIFLLVIADYCYADSASVKIQGLDEGSVDVVIRNISNNQPAQDGLITWSDVSAGQSGWKVANQYIEISHSELPEFWGMQIYTNNKNELADPMYTGTADPAGLVKTDNTIFSLPMAWRIADVVINPNTDENKPVQRQDGAGFTNYMWHFLKDKNTPDDSDTVINESFNDGESYVTLWNQSGIAWNEDGRSGNPKKAYIYLAANFTMSSVGAEYRTSALTIEAYKGISPFPIYLYKDAPLTEYPDELGATLENHFSPSGWMNSHGQYRIDPKCNEVTPYSGAHCFKIYWNGARTWGGIMWLEPYNIWDYGAAHPTHNGYDLRGADELSFWARTSAANVGMQLELGFGNNWDTGKTPVIARTPLLNTTWQRFAIPLHGLNMSDITGGLSIVFKSSRTPNYSQGAVIYIDEIKFDRY